MAASYPTSAKVFTSRNAGDIVQPANINDLQDEVNAIEAGLLGGTAPLTSSNASVNNLSVAKNSTIGSSITIGALPYIFPSAGGSTGQVLAISSTSGSTMVLAWTTPGGVQLLAKDFTELSVTSSAETSVLNAGAGYAISSGTLIAGKALRFMMNGNILNNSGSTGKITLKLKLGATTFYTGAFDVSNGFTTDGPTVVNAMVNANNAATSQRAVATWTVPGSNTVDGASTQAGAMQIGSHSALAEDMLAAKTFDATVLYNISGASVAFKRWAATLELLG